MRNQRIGHVVGALGVMSLTACLDFPEIGADPEALAQEAGYMELSPIMPEAFEPELADRGAELAADLDKRVSDLRHRGDALRTRLGEE